MRKKDDSELIGRIIEVDEEKITLTTKPKKKEKSKEIEISFDDIVEAKIEIEF